MSGTTLNGSSAHLPFTRIKIDGFDISCIASNPFYPGFSLGSDDGKVKFTDEFGSPLLEMNGSPSGEAINGIASFGKSIAVSSRQEIMERIWNPEEPGGRPTICRVPLGAHGITATPGGFYVAPIGVDGIMMMKAGAGPGDAVGVLKSERESMYFYRVLARKGTDGKDLLICAAPQGGIGAAEIRWGDTTYNMRVATFPEVDIVDVCFVGGGPEAPAMAAVGRTGELILSRDVMRDTNPMMMKFKNVQGRAYRLLNVGGHLFLLTSSGLYGLMDLGTRLMEGLPSGRFTTQIFVIPMEAVDASLICERWLMVVMPDEVLRFDLNSSHETLPHHIGNGETREFETETSEAEGEAVQSPYGFEDVSTGARELVGVP